MSKVTSKLANFSFNKGMLVVGSTNKQGNTNAACTINKPTGTSDNDTLICLQLTSDRSIPDLPGWSTVIYENIWGTGYSKIITKKASSEPLSYSITAHGAVMIAMRYVDVFASGSVIQSAGTSNLTVGQIVPGTFSLVFAVTDNSNKVDLNQTGGVTIEEIDKNSNLRGFFVLAGMFINKSGMTFTRSKTSGIFYGCLVGMV
jgi:hypothetical protein